MHKLFLKNVQPGPKRTPPTGNPTCKNIKKVMLPSLCSQLKYMLPPCSQLYSKKSNAIKWFEQTPMPNCSSQDANHIYNEILNCVGCNPTNNSGLSGGAIAGIVVGSVVGLALIIFLIYKYKRK